MFRHIDTENDEFVPVQSLCRKQFGKPVSYQTISRWLRTGVRGVRLEAVQVCGVWSTTPAAFAAFLEEKTAAALNLEVAS